MIETELRDALHARAEGVPVGVADPVARVITAVGADRRRRTTRGVAIVAALALATGLGSVLVRMSAQHSPAPAVTNSLPAPSDPAWADVLTWPARGSLIGDAGLVELLFEFGLDRAFIRNKHGMPQLPGQDGRACSGFTGAEYDDSHDG
ncbi:MAG TPA: hypothetical protein PLQ23_14590 [Dermatophilaceae bacterium]|mgnify:CR=1 FL=1|nr:hypothetical protein [Dermatophilaceae bacterium]